MEHLIAFAVFLATSCAANLDQSARISHGQDAEFNQFPYMIGMGAVEDYFTGLCGATLISQEWVLTAAHCVYKTNYVSLYLGSTLVDDATVSYKVYRRDIIVHSSYNPETFDNDIALIRIPKTTICSGIAPARLPKKSTIRSYAHEMGIAAGWGHISDNGPYAYRLQWAFMPIIPNEDCRALSGHDFSDSVLCVDTSSFKSICDGDSGGPLVLKRTGELVGVASMSSKSGCRSGKPAIFTRITYFLNWIERNTGISFE